MAAAFWSAGSAAGWLVFWAVSRDRPALWLALGFLLAARAGAVALNRNSRRRR